MTTHQREALFNSADSLQFRAWLTAIGDAIKAVGLVQTGDTGQIDKTAVLRPGSANIPAGYEIYRFNDTLQATRPIFIKIEYGTGAGLAFPSLWISVATATDGAGNVQGVMTERRQISHTGGASATSPLLTTSDASSLGLVTTRGLTNQSPTWEMLFFVERSRDPNGTPNGDGALVSWGGSSNSTTSLTQFMSFTNTTVAAAQSNQPIPFPAGRNPGGSGNSGTSVTLIPAVVVTPKAQGQSLLLLGCGINDFVRGSLVRARTGGALRTYYAVTGTNPARSAFGDAIGLLMRWE